MELTEKKFTSEQADEICGYRPGTFEKKRQRGQGPAYLKNGRSVRYAESQLKAWLEMNTRQTSDSRVTVS